MEKKRKKQTLKQNNSSKCFIVTKEELREHIDSLKKKHIIIASQKALIIGTAIVGISLYSSPVFSKEIIPEDILHHNISEAKNDFAGKDILIARNSDREEEWLEKGNLLYSQGRQEEALKCYDKALEIDPEFVPALCGKGIILYYQRNYEEAIQCYDKALKVKSNFCDAWYGKGIVLYRQGNFGEAIKCYNRALEINPAFADCWYSKGVVLYRQGNYEEAVKCYDKALKIKPEAIYAAREKVLALRGLNSSVNRNNYMPCTGCISSLTSDGSYLYCKVYISPSVCSPGYDSSTGSYCSGTCTGSYLSTKSSWGVCSMVTGCTVCTSGTGCTYYISP